MALAVSVLPTPVGPRSKTSRWGCWARKLLGAAPQDVGDPGESFAVPDDARRHQLIPSEHPVAVGLEQAIDGNLRELRHHFGDLLRAHARLAPSTRPRASEVHDADGFVGHARPGK